MSLSGLTQNYIPATLDGLNVVEADQIYIDGQLVDLDNLVPYTGATKPVDTGAQPIRTSYNAIATNDVVNLLTLQNAIQYVEQGASLTFLNKTITSSQTVAGPVVFAGDTLTLNTNTTANGATTFNQLVQAKDLQMLTSDGIGSWELTSSGTGSGGPYDLTLHSNQTTNDIIFRDTGKIEAKGYKDTDATANRVAVFDANKELTSNSITTTELGYLSGTTSNIQSQINAIVSGGTVSLSGNNTWTGSNTYTGTISGTALPDYKGISVSATGTDNSGVAFFKGTAPNNFYGNLRTYTSGTDKFMTLDGVNGSIIYGDGTTNVVQGSLSTGALSVIPSINLRGQLFTVGGVIGTFYPVVFDVGPSWYTAGKFYIGINRGSVHQDTPPDWKGSLTSWIEGHNTNWGNGANYISWNVVNGPPQATYRRFIADIQQASTSNGVIVWLRGASSYYFTGIGASLYYPNSGGVSPYTLPWGSGLEVFNARTTLAGGFDYNSFTYDSIKGFSSLDNDISLAGRFYTPTRGTFGYVYNSKPGIFIDNTDAYGGSPCIQAVNTTFGTGDMALNPVGGNVGIGTISPVSKLHVNGTITTPSRVVITNGDPGDLISKRYALGDRYGIGQYNLGTTRVFTSNTYTGASIRFSRPLDDLTDGSATFTDLMTIDYYGRVGIGTATPYSYAKLHVYDNASYSYISVQNASATGYTALQIANNGTSGYLFRNGSSRSDDGGVNTMTLRNDGGSLRLQPQNRDGIKMNSSGQFMFGSTVNDGSEGRYNFFVDGYANFTPSAWSSTEHYLITSGYDKNSGYNRMAGGYMCWNQGLSEFTIGSLYPNQAWLNMNICASQIDFYHSGAVCAYTQWWGIQNISDARCKRDIADLKTSRSLERVLQARPKYYKRVLPKNPSVPIPEEIAESYGIGLLAQDMESVNPHCVGKWMDKTDKPDDVEEKEYKGEERLGINYHDWTIHLIGAVQEIVKQSTSQAELVQEQQKMITAQQETITKLQKDFDDYKAITEERFNKLAILLGKV